MKFALIIHNNDAETVWNAFRLANTSLKNGDEVTVFLLGKGVESGAMDSFKFNIQEQVDTFHELKGELLGCGICVESRKQEMPMLMEELKCKTGSMQQLYEIVRDFDRVLAF